MLDFRFFRDRLSLGIAVCGLAVILSAAALAQETAATAEDDSLEADRGNQFILPVVGYTPDTGLVLGATYLRFIYLEPEFPDARPSVFSPIFLYSLKKQIMAFLLVGLNWDQNRNALQVTPGYIDYPDKFYGVGRQVDLDDEESFTSERIGLNAGYNRRLLGGWRLGLAYDFIKHRVTEMDPGGMLAGGTIPGTQDSRTSGLGPTLALDSRDNIWSPQHGLWLQLNLILAGSDLGSDYTYQETTLDLRGYRQLGTDLVLAAQYLTTRLDGDPPFFKLPVLGGDTGLRGFRASLYRGRTRALARLELRRNHLWGRIGAVAFAGIGDVAPSPGKLTLAGQLWSAGIGLRYMLNPKEKVNLRMDFGLGNGDSAFFLAFGEAF